MASLRARVYGLTQGHRKACAFTLYAAVAALGYAGAYFLRFELGWDSSYTGTFLVTLPVLVAVRLVAAQLFRLAAGRWRYVGVSDVLRLVGATVFGTLLFVAAVMLLPLPRRVPRSVVLLEWLITLDLTAAVWIAYRSSFQFLKRRSWDAQRSAKRVLLVGAGQAGSRLAHEMVSFPTGYAPLGFVDDDPLKWGTRIHGVDVVGGTQDLTAIARHHGADLIVIAMPSASPSELRRIVVACEDTVIPYKVLPGIREVLDGEVRLSQLRDVQIEDLLGREPVSLSLPELAEDFTDKAILITGAAGSIGGELSRQVARHHPRVLVLLDQAESALYLLERELEADHPELEVATVVGDIVDEAAVEAVFQRFRPERVFHAAAYKHVPMMEANAREAVKNNVVGTYIVATAAGRHGCERFVLVSTDKAVHPSNVMGATKALAEHIILAADEEYPATRFLGVRFGNVLGSQGSVLPIFRRQMEEGRLLTLTHPDATRFFMTIPEASQLVLQASLLPAAWGRIAMLDMGEPVRILDLARNLVRLSGDHRDPDSRITYVGLRPGEKLHEELRSGEEELIGTRIPKVHVIGRLRRYPGQDVVDWMERWRDTLDDSDVMASLDRVWAWCCLRMDSRPAERPAVAGRPSA